MRILAFTRYSRLGASSRLRMFQYLPHLARRNLDITYSPFFDDQYLQRLYSGEGRNLYDLLRAFTNRFVKMLNAGNFDVIWLEKEVFPILPAWLEKILSMSGKPYVVDYDDAVFHNYDLNNHLIVRKLLGRKIDHVMKNAVLVVTGNDYLASRARFAGAHRVEILPTAVDVGTYKPLEDIPGSDTFTIGWIGSPSTTQHLQLIESALSASCSINGTRLITIGASPLNIESIAAEQKPWQEAREVADIQSFDVGIMPLPDEPWERGKCGYKLIQYMACGKPVIASPVGVNKEIVEHGINGFLAETPKEWEQALAKLKASRELRVQMGMAGRAKVERKFSTQVVGPKLVELLIEAAKSEP